MTVNSLGGVPADGRSRTAAWYAPLVPIAISIFAVSALVSYHLRSGTITGTRTFAQSLIVGIYEFFGWVPSCMFFGLVLAWSSIWWATGTIEQPGKKLARIGYLTLALAVFGNLDAAAPHTGLLGSWIGGGLAAVLGSFLSHLLMAPLTFLALLLATDYFWMSYFERRAFERTLPAAAPGLAGGIAMPEAGVEAAVTDEFKELARILPQHVAPTAEVDRAPLEAFSKPEVDAALDRYFDGSTAPLSAPEVDADGSRSQEVGADEHVRLSYFERRQLRAEREASADTLEAAAASAADNAVVEFRAADPRTAGEAVEAEIAEALSAPPDEGEVASLAAEPVVEESIPFEPVPVESIPVASAPSVAGGLRAEDMAARDSEGPVEMPPILEETALRAALGFEAEATSPAPEAPVESTEAASSYEVRHEPLFPSAAPVLDDRDEEEDEREGIDEVAAAREATEPEAAVGESADLEGDRVVLAPQPPVERSRGFLAPVREEAEDVDVASEPEDELARESAATELEPVVAIPRPPEGPRQQSLFVSTLDEALVRDALDVLQANHRASASMLQRRLRIDYEQAKEVLALLAHRGLVDLAEDGSLARRRT